MAWRHANVMNSRASPWLAWAAAPWNYPRNVRSRKEACMPTLPILSDMGKRLRDACDRRSLLRGFVVSAGGVVLMFCCLTILTLSSCVLGQ
jgi:hypothetical protein